MDHTAQKWDKAIDAVFENLFAGRMARSEAYHELLYLGYDEDKAYKEIYKIPRDRDDTV